MNFRKFLLISISFYLVLISFSNDAHAGAVINKPPVTLGLISGLVGYWSFDGNAMGTTSALDLSGNDNIGWLRNGPKKTIGRIGQALSFDGSNDFVDLGDVLNLSLPISVSAWVKVDTFSTANAIFSTDKTTSTHSGLWSQISTTGTIEFSFGDNLGIGAGSRRSKLSTATVTTNRWYHIAGVVRGATDIDIYIDGVDAGGTYSGTGGSITNTTRSARIGLNEDSINDEFDGTIDEVRIYNRVLSPDEIRRLYKIGATFKINTPSNTGTLKDGLVGYWPFDGADIAGVTTYDRSGQNNNGTLKNGPTRIIGKIGQALSFDGASTGVDTTSDFVLTNPTTYTAWVYTRSYGTQGEGRIIDNNRTYIAVLSTNGGRFQCSSDGGSNVAVSADSALSLNTWMFVACTRNSSGVTNVYVNGVLSGTANQNGGTPVNGTANVDVGRRTTGQWFDGLIDEARIYNRVLGQDEIRRLYKIGATFKINTPSNTGTLKDGLVGYWSFDGNAMGTTSALDLSGNGNIGWLSNGPIRTIGKIGQALSFDGISDFVSAGPINLTSADKITTAFWLKKDSFANDDRLALESSTNFNSNDGAILIDPNSGTCPGQFEINMQDSVGLNKYSQTCFARPSAGEWHHYAFIFDDSTIAGDSIAYVDGQLQSGTQVSTKDKTGTFGNYNWYFMSRGGASLFGAGELDEVRVYNRVLSADEIKRLYNMGR